MNLFGIILGLSMFFFSLGSLIEFVVPLTTNAQIIGMGFYCLMGFAIFFMSLYLNNKEEKTWQN